MSILFYAIVHFFNHLSSYHSYRLYHLIMCLPARTFSRLVGEADYPPLKFIPALWLVVIFPLGFSLTSCIPNTLDFRRNLEESTLILRVPFSVFLMSSIFQSRLQSFRQVFFRSSVRGLIFSFAGFSAMSYLGIYLRTLFLSVL